jgi:cytochrome c553
MKVQKRICLRLAAVAALASAAAAGGMWGVGDTAPSWAYGTKASGPAPHEEGVPDSGPKHIPGSLLAFTPAQIQDHFGPADWFPGDHPPMPAVVAQGRKPQVWACALCHYPNGKGKPENASVAGFPVSYFVEQMHEFRAGERKSADPGKKNTALMSSIATAMTHEEISEAANYFGSMKWTPWIKVVETESVPKMYSSVGMYMPLPGNEKEPIGQRIIETPQDPEGTEMLRNPRSGFVAYVPVGSIEKGKKLVDTGGGKTVACSVCHGADLQGMGPVPGLAGRSPSYLVRQLYDMQQGTRRGEWTELMKPVVTKLSQEDMLNIAAYTASCRP